MTDGIHHAPPPPRRPAPTERRRYPRYATDLRATVRIGTGVGLFGRLVDLSQGGACIEFPQPVRGWPGQWIVLDGETPLRFGYDACVVAVDDRRWRLAFDPALVELGIFKSAPTGAAEAGGKRSSRF
jgi:hypothetical protein